MTACTHSTVIEDARNSQPKRINATSPILSHQTIITMKHRMLEREEVHCKNVRVIITLVWSSQLHLFSGFYYTRMITVYKPHIEILIATFCFQNWWSRAAKALQSWETPNRCNSDNHSNFKITLTFLQCKSLVRLNKLDMSNYIYSTRRH